MAGIAPPNFTQIPNEILDSMHLMHESELRVLLAVCRKTFGWHKDADVLSLSQLMKLTGMSKPSVMAGIDAGIARGFLARVPASKQSFSYRLLVKPVDQSNDFTSQDTLPEPVKPVDRQPVKPFDTQKKGLNKKENGGVEAPTPKTPPPDKTDHPEIRHRLSTVNVRPTDITHWLKLRPQATIADADACIAWCIANGRPNGTLDRPQSMLWKEYLCRGDCPPQPPGEPAAKESPLEYDEIETPDGKFIAIPRDPARHAHIQTQHRAEQASVRLR